MKGVILAGGKGTRLAPLTKVTSKQLLHVYDRPLIYYPLEILLKAGIKEVCFVVAPEHAGDYLAYLGSGKDFGARFSYEIQDEPAGLAHGLLLTENFADKEPIAFILGDNIFEDDLSEEIKSFSGEGAKIFAKEVPDPDRFGVVEFDKDLNVISIEEKPKNPKSNFGQPGFYIYDTTVYDKIHTLKPSVRGEYEITDLNNIYLKEGKLKVGIIKGRWIDAGTFDSLLEANIFMAKRKQSAAPSLQTGYLLEQNKDVIRKIADSL